MSPTTVGMPEFTVLSEYGAVSHRIDLWQRICAFTRDYSLRGEEREKNLEGTLRQYRIPLAESVPLFASLLSLPLAGDRYPPLALSPQKATPEAAGNHPHHAPRVGGTQTTALYP